MNCISSSSIYKKILKDNFIRYVKIWSESDGEAADNGVFPSTERQWDFARVLENELKELGLKNVCVTENCYVYGFLPGSGELAKEEPVLFLAHMDTVDEVSGKDVKPVLEEKDGDIIIHSDGNTLLGGDDKAGVAAIMTAVEFLVKANNGCEAAINDVTSNTNSEATVNSYAAVNGSTTNKEASSEAIPAPLSHRPVEVIFSPDEETGHGMDRVPMELIHSKSAYTVDGGDEGEMETECFNAWAASVEFTGKACHTGTAKADGMINANLMASYFISLLPENERPETTEDHQGFIAVMKTEGSIENSSVDLLLRSFCLEEIEDEKAVIERAVRETEAKFGGKGKVTFTQQYLNMKEKLDAAPEVASRLEKAYESAGAKIVRKPIRGGTDGSRLTEMGIPTPNIFTGAHEFHSRNEWVSLNQMSKASDIVVNILCNF